MLGIGIKVRVIGHYLGGQKIFTCLVTLHNSKVRTFTFNGTTFHLQLVLKVQDSRLNNNKLHVLLILFIKVTFRKCNFAISI